LHGENTLKARSTLSQELVRSGVSGSWSRDLKFVGRMIDKLKEAMSSGTIN
jgi:hypothetical protein